MVGKEKAEPTARTSLTRRDFLVASFATAAGLAVGGRLGREVFPKVVETPGPVVTTTTTKTEQTTQTVTQTVMPPGSPKTQLPEIRMVDKPHYARDVVGPVERFDQRYTGAARCLWDPMLQSLFFVEQPKNKLEHIKRNDLGYRLEDYALTDAGGCILNISGSGPTNTGRGDVGLYKWEAPLSPIKLSVDDPAEMSEKIKYAARVVGADLVGICELDQRWVYSYALDERVVKPGDPGPGIPLNIPYKYAIVMGIEMSWELIKQSPNCASRTASNLGYSKMAFVAPSLAQYIRSLGYPAIPSGNDTAPNIPLAIDAGLGELGRSGLLITPQFGPRLRVCKVFTDLPLKPDKPIEFGVQEFCEKKCPDGGLCAKKCPGQALMYGPQRVAEGPTISNRKGILRWVVDAEKCLKFWCENGTNCSTCIKVCPLGV